MAVGQTGARHPWISLFFRAPPLEVLLTSGRLAAAWGEVAIYVVSEQWARGLDLAIVVVSIGFAATGGSGSTVAVGRLLRLVKVVLKIPQLRFVLLGFAAGLRAVVPIMLLMLLIIYLCARDLVGGGALRILRI